MNATAVPVAQDLFRWQDGAVHLVGSRCQGCGTHYFPKCLSCRNPTCRQKAVGEVLLSRHGRLFSFTIQAYRPPPLFKIECWAPYAIGLVEFPEGLRIMGMLCGAALDQFRIDMPLEVTVEALYHDVTGRAVMTYKFKP